VKKKEKKTRKKRKKEKYFQTILCVRFNKEEKAVSSFKYSTFSTTLISYPPLIKPS